MTDPHHDHQNGNMMIQPTTHHCSLCHSAEGDHSRTCARRSMTGKTYEVNGVAHGDFPDGKYLVETARGQYIGAYFNNDWNGNQPDLTVTFDDDTREIDPREIVRLARIVEV